MGALTGSVIRLCFRRVRGNQPRANPRPLGWQDGTTLGGPIYSVTSACQLHQGDPLPGWVSCVSPGCCSEAGAHVTGLGAGCIIPVPLCGGHTHTSPTAVHHQLSTAAASASSSPQRALACRRQEISPASMTSPPAARRWWELLVTSCSSPPIWPLAPQGRGQDAGVDVEGKEEGAGREGAGACPCGDKEWGVRADPACAEATLRRCPGRCRCPALLLSPSSSCSAAPGSAQPPQVSDLVGLGGDGAGQEHVPWDLGHPPVSGTL